MAKWTKDAIVERIKPGSFTQEAQGELERTRARIEPQLIELLRYPNAFVREIAATVLGERRNPHSIPALVKAVADRSNHVAFDAIVAIEKCAGLATGELVSALFLDLSKPQSGAHRVAAWWQIVRKEVLS